MAYENISGRKIFRWLKDINFKTRTGKDLTFGNIYRMLRVHFYYGEFEYPEGSGNWYKGKHTPIITKELFEQVQLKIRVEQKKSYGREFSFTNMLECGCCGSKITGEEKIRELVGGGANAHIYYRCTKHKDISCENLQVSEEILIAEMLKIIHDLSLNKSELREKLEKEVARYTLFQTGVLQQKVKTTPKQQDISIKTFAKYLLQHGTLTEKREVLFCIKSKIILKDKKLMLGE